MSGPLPESLRPGLLWAWDAVMPALLAPNHISGSTVLGGTFPQAQVELACPPPAGIRGLANRTYIPEDDASVQRGEAALPWPMDFTLSVAGEQLWLTLLTLSEPSEGQTPP